MVGSDNIAIYTSDRKMKHTLRYLLLDEWMRMDRNRPCGRHGGSWMMRTWWYDWTGRAYTAEWYKKN